MNQSYYDRLRRQIDEKYAADIAALERIRELSAGSEVAAPVELTVRPEALEEAVKAVLPTIEGVFNKRVLAARLRQADPTLPPDVHNMLGGILKQMEDKEVRLVKRGQGKRASDYEVLKPLPLPLDDDDVLPKD